MKDLSLKTLSGQEKKIKNEILRALSEHRTSIETMIKDRLSLPKVSLTVDFNSSPVTSQASRSSILTANYGMVDWFCEDDSLIQLLKLQLPTLVDNTNTVTNTHKRLFKSITLALSNILFPNGENSIIDEVKLRDNQQSLFLTLTFTSINNIFSISGSLNQAILDGIERSIMKTESLPDNPMSNLINKIKTKASAELMSTTISLSQLKKLSKGDFIPMSSISDTVLKINDTPWINGTIINDGGFIGVRIDSDTL